MASARLSNLMLEKRFLDTLRLNVKGGSGGMGLPKYGGVGGRGGHVYLKAQAGVDLKSVSKKFRGNLATAANGQSSKKSRIFGKAGEDKVIEVPIGVTVYDSLDRKLGELNKLGQTIMVAQGGPGGGPSSHPQYCGVKGISKFVKIDLNLIADVGLVGFPNAGKSTLLKAISRAQPKIAAYAFTTLQPNLGVMEYPDLRQITVADLPGIIEGSHYNLGMGHKFLRHIERSRLLLMVVDIFGFRISPSRPFRNCLETILLLNKELELYNPDLLDKPVVLAINKMDLPGAHEELENIEKHLDDLTDFASQLPEDIRPERVVQFRNRLTLSAKDMDKVDEVRQMLRQEMDLAFERTFIEEASKNEEDLLAEIKRRKVEIGPSLI